MNNMYLKLMITLQNLLNNEEGQDLIEYALLVALIAVAAIAGTRTLATQVSTTFTSVAGVLGTAH